jgi:exodeoxyribonuclease VII large subunit
VGVVTSIQGAAMHDIVRVAAARLAVRIVVADCRVQGQEAPASIVAALRAIQRLPEVDVVIVGRGGGSQEDLWAFNHESVARAVAACRVPTVSAVGHEVDVTITDLVADVRAATPSNAAEIVVPDRRALGQELDAFERRLARALDTRIGRSRLALERLARALSDPRHAVSGARAELEGLAARLERAMARAIAVGRRGLATRATRLARLDPRARLARDRSRHADLAKRLERAAADALGRRRDRLGRAMARLDALSPLAVLARGYAIALHAETGRALVRASDARAGDVVTVRLHEGAIETSVVAVRVEPE